MAKVVYGRRAASVEGDFVVFLIGAQVLKPWKVHRWLPVARAMNRMLKELENDPGSGFLGYERYGALNGVIVQYWRSFEHLERYARARDRAHFPAWVEFNRSVRDNDTLGIWHETYLVPAGSYEAIYHNCRPTGLGKAGTLAPAKGQHATAAGRLGREGTAYPEESLGLVEV